MSRTLFDGQLFDILPPPWKTEEAQAISFALDWGVHLITELAKKTRIRADVNDLSERTLDIMAQEMNAPYYSQDLPIATKREIIRHTIRWYMHAGTPSAVRELMEVVFGEGDVIENWDFEDEPRSPYTFDLITGAPARPDTRNKLLGMIHRVKNERSHLRYIYYRRTIDSTLYLGGGIESMRHGWSAHGRHGERDLDSQLYAGLGLETMSAQYSGAGSHRSRDIAAALYTTAALQEIPERRGGTRSQQMRDISSKIRIGASLWATRERTAASRPTVQRELDGPVMYGAGITRVKSRASGPRGPASYNISMYLGAAMSPLSSVPPAATSCGASRAASLTAPVRYGAGISCIRSSTGG